MITRCELIAASAISAAALVPTPAWPVASESASLKHRAIASSGKSIPVIGLGTSGHFKAGDSATEKIRPRGVIINRCFGDGFLFAKVRSRGQPARADETSVRAWAHHAKKLSLAHPATTAVIAVASKPERQTENLRADTGPGFNPHHCAELVARFS